MNELVSIIIPIYNSEKYLEECLNSVLKQTYKNIEIILVNDGSTDKSLEICENFMKIDNRIKVYNRKNCGVSESRNFGISVSTGKYITFCDSDDYMDENMIEKLYNTIVERNVDVVRCKTKILKEQSIVYEKLYDLSNRKISGKDEILNALNHFITYKELICCYIYTLIIKKDVIVNFNSKLFFMEDTEFYTRLFMNVNSIYFLDESLHNYRYNPNGASKDINKFNKIILGSIDSADEIKEFLKEKNVLTSKLENSINVNILYLMFARLKIISQQKDINTKKFLKELFENKKVQELIKVINVPELSKSKKIEYYMIKNKLYGLLSIFIKITNLRKNN